MRAPYQALLSAALLATAGPAWAAVADENRDQQAQAAPAQAAPAPAEADQPRPAQEPAAATQPEPAKPDPTRSETGPEQDQGGATRPAPAKPAAAQPAAAQPASGQGGNEQSNAILGTESSQSTEGKNWSINALFETHWLVIRDNQPKNDVYSFMYLLGSYDITKKDRIALRLDATQRYLVDQGESGFLMGETRLYYSRAFDFKLFGQQFDGRGSFYFTFPTSKLTQKEGNISKPTVVISVSKELPFGLTLVAKPDSRYNWCKYAELEGGGANVRWNVGYDLLAIYQLPGPAWLHSASVGVGWGQEWFDKYPSREGYSQPWNWQYYWDLFLGYEVLTKPIGLDFYLSLSSGKSVLEDGVFRFYWTNRHETEMYFSIFARY